MPVNDRIQLRRGTEAQWIAAEAADADAEPLADGEPGVVVDADGVPLYLVVGDTGTEFEDLPRFSPDSALSGAFAAVTGSIEGGQVLGPMRQPTLTVDKRFPNRRFPWRLLWADGDTYYALGRDRTIYKSTNAGTSWTAKGAPATGTLGGNGVFLKTQTGTLISYVGAASPVLMRSTDDGATWATVETLRSGRSLLGAQSICEDLVTGHLYYVEYGTNAADADVKIRRSTDDGATWSDFHTFPGPGTTDPDRVRHLHGCQWDPVSERVYFTAGDSEAAAGIYRVNAAGDGVESVFTNNDQANTATAIGLMFFPDYIAWGGDSPAPHNNIMRLPRAQIGQPGLAAESVYRLSSTGWFTCPVSADGSAWLVTASNEGVGNYALDAAVHVYLVEDNGARVFEVAAIAHDGGGSGWPAIAPLGSTTVQGDTFWLQSHKWGQPWQMRCQIARGWQRIEPVEKPPLVPAWVTASSGPVTVPAGGSVIFGYTVTGDDMGVLKTYDFGVYRTGGAGTLRVEQFNASTSTLLTHTNASSYRRAINAEDAEFVRTQGGFTAGQAIVFRLTETGGEAEATGVGFVTYGWAAE